MELKFGERNILSDEKITDRELTYEYAIDIICGITEGKR
jgi:hypothetical protein